MTQDWPVHKVFKGQPGSLDNQEVLDSLVCRDLKAVLEQEDRLDRLDRWDHEAKQDTQDRLDLLETLATEV